MRERWLYVRMLSRPNQRWLRSCSGFIFMAGDRPLLSAADHINERQQWSVPCRWCSFPPVHARERREEAHPDADDGKRTDGARHDRAGGADELRHGARAEFAELVARADEGRVHSAHTPAQLVGRL